MKKKYVCFDIGNVLLRVSFDNFKLKLSELLEISQEEGEYFLRRTQPYHDQGLTNIKDELVDWFDIKSDAIVEDLLQEWDKTLYADEYMNDLLYTLLMNEVNVALLSNIGFEHIPIVKNIFGELYGKCIKFLSCEVGCRKPSLLYYKTFLDLFPEFKNCLYVDDRQENLEMGKRLGFDTLSIDLDNIYNKAGADKIKQEAAIISNTDFIANKILL